MLQIKGGTIDFVALFTSGGGAFGYNTATSPSCFIFRRRYGENVVDGVVGGTVISLGNGFYTCRAVDDGLGGFYFAQFTTDDTGADKLIVQSESVCVGNELATHLYEKTALIGAAGVDIEQAAAVFGEPLIALADVRYERAISLAGRTIAGWTKLVFTIKSEPENDSDDEALIVVRLSNPAAPGTDGIIRHRGRAVDAADAMRGNAGLSVASVDPATFTVTIKAAGMDLPPSDQTLPYTYGVDVWRNSDKESLADGDFTLSQSVRRSSVSP